MIETDLLKKYIAGDVTQDEKETVQLWLEADKKNMKEYIALRTLYDITLVNLEETEASLSINSKNHKRRSILSEIAKIAAIALLAIGVSYTLFLYIGADKHGDTTMQTLFVPAGQRAELTLADGSKVWLNAQTTLTFPTIFKPGSREVFLDGEGYFKVTKNEKHKFVVNTPQYNINVLGTEFDVSAYRKYNNFKTSLITGSVEVVSKDNSVKMLLNPGEYIYKKDNKLELMPIVHSDYFLWKDGIISFEQERLEEIFNKLRVIYDVDIKNHNKGIIDLRRTFKFHTTDGIEQIMNVLKITFGFQFKINDKSNQIDVW